MSSSTESLPTKPATNPTAASMHDSLSRRTLRALSFRNIGAVYVWAVIAVIFSFWASETFPTWATVNQVLEARLF